MGSAASTDRPIRLFYSYSHLDEAFRRELGAHLSPLRRGKLVDEWHDRLIDAGTAWKAEIDRNLASADIVLLLVSADFINSDYCWGEEMTQALARHTAGEASVVPVILRRCRWMSTPLANLQAVPKDGVPVSEWNNRDAAFDDVAAAVERIIKALRDQRRRAAEEAKRREKEEWHRREREAEEVRQQAEAVRVAEARRRQAIEEAERRDKAEPLPREHQAEGTRRREKAEAASASPAAAPSPGAEEAPPSPTSGRGFAAAAEDQKPLPYTGEVGALAVGEGAATARSGSGKHRSRVLITTGTAIAVASSAGFVATRLYDHGDDRLQTAAQVSTPPDTFRDCAYYCPDMIAIPGDIFTMGSPSDEKRRADDEGPQHQVLIRPFAIGAREVTFDEWDACVAAGGCNGYRPEDENWGRGSRPVINVSWEDAQAFVSWLAKKTGQPYRLPTEAEWEYATRAGTTTPFSFGNTISTTQANYDGTYVYRSGSQGAYWRKTIPSGSLSANPWGLFDVHGNVWEWVEDCYHVSYKDAPQDGSAWVSNGCAARVARGGFWGSYPWVLRSACRGKYQPDRRDNTLGFRVARTL